METIFISVKYSAKGSTKGKNKEKFGEKFTRSDMLEGVVRLAKAKFGRRNRSAVVGRRRDFSYSVNVFRRNIHFLNMLTFSLFLGISSAL